MKTHLLLLVAHHIPKHDLAIKKNREELRPIVTPLRANYRSAIRKIALALKTLLTHTVNVDITGPVAGLEDILVGVRHESQTLDSILRVLLALQV